MNINKYENINHDAILLRKSVFFTSYINTQNEKRRLPETLDVRGEERSQTCDWFVLREVASQRWLFVSDDDQGWIISSSLPGTLCKMWFVADDSHQWKVTLEFRQHCQITVKSFKLHLETSAVIDHDTDVKKFRPI